MYNAGMAVGFGPTEPASGTLDNSRYGFPSGVPDRPHKYRPAQDNIVNFAARYTNVRMYTYMHPLTSIIFCQITRK